MRIDLASLDKCPDRPSPFGPTRKVVRGSDHGRAKLNEVTVQYIRDMAEKLGTSPKVLSVLFSVDQSTVYAILSGERWAHAKSHTNSIKRRLWSSVNVQRSMKKKVK
jgi:hypothetical protein